MVDKKDHIWIATGSGVSDYYPGSYGINEIPMEVGTIYPNPASDVLVIKHKSKDSTLNLFDAEGKLTITSKLSGETTDINVTSLHTGIYLLQIKELDKIYSSKIIIR